MSDIAIPGLWFAANMGSKKKRKNIQTWLFIYFLNRNTSMHERNILSLQTCLNGTNIQT